MDRETPVMSASFQENISKFSFCKLQSSVLPFSDRLPPIVTVCFGYSRWITTLIPFAPVGSLGNEHFVRGRWDCLDFPETQTADDTLYGDEDLTTMKFIRTLVECSSSPKVTISDIFPSGHDISPLNPRRRVVV
nr:hypothetical protein [Tanacetum cinerariifolium]